MVGVAGMVAEWLSLDERLIFQQVSQIIAFQRKMELGRAVWDPLEADTWTLLSSEFEQYYYEIQGNAFAFPEGWCSQDPFVAHAVALRPAPRLLLPSLTLRTQVKGLAGPRVVRLVGASVVVPRPPFLSEAVTCAPAHLRAPEVDGCGGGGAGGTAAPAAFAALQEARCSGPGDAGLPPEAELIEAMVVAVARAEAWHLELLQRGKCEHVQRQQ